MSAYDPGSYWHRHTDTSDSTKDGGEVVPLGHIGIAISDTQMIEAPYTGASVWITGVRTGDGFVGVGRVT